jgi:hypothetical protein
MGNDRGEMGWCGSWICSSGKEGKSARMISRRTGEVRGGSALREGTQELGAVRAVPDRVGGGGLGLQSEKEGDVNRMLACFLATSRMTAASYDALWVYKTEAPKGSRVHAKDEEILPSRFGAWWWCAAGNETRNMRKSTR